MDSASRSTCTSLSTRGMWLVGATSEAILGCKLPSNRQVLSRFYFSHNNESKPIAEGALTTALEVIDIWEKAHIPTRQKCHVVKKIKDKFNSWKHLKKNSKRRSSAQIAKENSFIVDLDDVFDIAHADALNMIKIQEDRDFLLAQREKGRRGSIGAMDMHLAKVEQRRLEREVKADARKKREEQRVQLQASKNHIQESSSSSESDIVKPEDALQLSTSTIPKRPKLVSVITPEVTAALDRTKVTDRKAMYLISAFAKSLGHDPKGLVLNKESIRQARHRHREHTVCGVMESFVANVPLTVHWDGKLLPELTGKETVDRLAVIVSGQDTMKLLGVPKLPNGTGEAQAAAVFKLLQDWKIIDKVSFMSSDTTSSNTGSHAGACTLLKKKMQKPLLYLPCRHHIYELIVARVFDKLMATSTGPNIKLFQRFSSQWKNIDRMQLSPGIVDESVAEELGPMKKNLIDFFSNQLSDFHTRDDYKELLLLALLFLGWKPDYEVHINAPGVYHRARWMAKMIYSLKIFLFRKQFHLTKRELSGLRQFNVFVVRLYLKAWYTCQNAAKAPRNDLKLIQDLIAYKVVNNPVATTSLKSFSRHLWYLSETLIGLALFDPDVTPQVKDAMILALNRKGDEKSVTRLNTSGELMANKELHEFVSSNTKDLFVALDLKTDFLFLESTKWQRDESYLNAQKRVAGLKVVNDAAERGIALMNDYNSFLSNQEEQKQFILQVVETHRNRFPNAKKATVSK